MTNQSKVRFLSDVTPKKPVRTIMDSNDSVMTLYEGDCREVLANLPARSVHLALTDPPYFLDRLDDGWDQGKIKKSQKNANVIGGLPVGMKFDRAQGPRLQKFLKPISEDLFRILKPGAFLLMFAAPRLSHRAAVAVEDAGFEIRDIYAWRYTKKAQFKAFKVDHFVRNKTDINETKKKEMIRRLDGRKTPQLRPQFEAIICAQKPREGTFVDNWLRYETGLVDAKPSSSGSAPATVMTCEKEPKDRFNGHLTPKPVRLCQHLIKIFSKEGQTVIDPFLGSGTTAIAARKAKRDSIGIEVNSEYAEIVKKRWENM